MLPVTPRLPPAVPAAFSVPSGRLQRFPPIPASSQPRGECPPLLHAICSCPKPRQLTGFITPQPPPSCSSAAVMGWQRFLPTHRATFPTRPPLPPRAVPGHFGRLPTLPPLPAHRTPLFPLAPASPAQLPGPGPFYPTGLYTELHLGAMHKHLQNYRLKIKRVSSP